MKLPWNEPIELWRNLTQPQPLFTFNGRVHPYFLHGYHSTYRNERCVEVPIALDFMRPGDAVLEVGNVLNHYVQFPHLTVDKYERYPGVRNEDAVDFNPGTTFDLILSVSTLEHVGWDETPREPEKFHRALANLKQLLKPGGRLVFTLPLGYNTWLDDEIKSARVPVSQAWYLRRTAFRTWEECDLDAVREVRFGIPYWCANAIMVGEFRAPRVS